MVESGNESADDNNNDEDIPPDDAAEYDEDSPYPKPPDARLYPNINRVLESAAEAL